MDKKQFIKDLLPDLLDLIERKLDQDEKEPEKPKAARATKKGTKKTATKKPTGKQTAKKPTRTKTRVSKATPKKSSSVLKKNIPNNKFVDDLSESPELIKLDKLVCVPRSGKKPDRQIIKASKKICGMTTDESGQKISIGGCGKEFQAVGSYLCDRCLEGIKRA